MLKREIGVGFAVGPEQAVAAEAISWGDPVLPSAISTVANGRLWYGGQDAVDLAETASLEDIAALLWGDFPGLPDIAPVTSSGITAAMSALVERAAADPPSTFRYPAALRADAARPQSVDQHPEPVARSRVVVHPLHREGHGPSLRAHPGRGKARHPFC